ncbi:MAG TPA: alpha/beta fold hydrolase [Burkholderiales bacterium]|nr:alpha/beta fold hydrolase [Burkholderiales bacterium]
MSKRPESMSFPHQATVIVVHGLWVNSLIMRPLALRIEHCGYAVSCFSYASVRATLTQNAARLAEFVAVLSASTVHFVGHSLGGLVVLQMLKQGADRRIGRIVLMGTPCGGSHAARVLAKSGPGQWLLGLSMPVGEMHLAAPACHDLGVIAGDRGLGLGRFLAPGLPHPNDGVVTVNETRIAGMKDHIVMRVSHSGMLFSSRAASQVCAFLTNGHFRQH